MPEISNTWSLQHFVKEDDANPCLMANTESRFYCPVRKETVDWEGKDVFNPAAVVRDDKVYLLYRAEDTVGKHAGTSRIGLAESSDGLTFTKHPEPVFYPDNSPMNAYEWEGGVEDPRIVEDEDGTYYMTYTAYDGAKARLCIATSNDLYHWHKHGLVFDKDYCRDLWSKSGSIVCRREDDRLIATRINGVYWMYWGESNIYIAISKDLIHWHPVFNRQRDHDREFYGQHFLSVFSSNVKNPLALVVVVTEG